MGNYVFRGCFLGEAFSKAALTSGVVSCSVSCSTCVAPFYLPFPPALPSPRPGSQRVGAFEGGRMNLCERFAESSGEAGTAAISPLHLFTCCGAQPLQQGSEPQLARLFIPAWDCLTPGGYRRTHHQTRLLAWKVVPAGEQNPALPLSCRSSQSINASAVAYEERMDRQTDRHLEQRRDRAGFSVPAWGARISKAEVISHVAVLAGCSSAFACSVVL